MIKNLTQLEVIVDGKVGHFLLEQDTTTVIAKEMCLQFLKYIGQIEDSVKANKAEVKEDDKVESLPAEDVKE